MGTHIFLAKNKEEKKQYLIYTYAHTHIYDTWLRLHVRRLIRSWLRPPLALFPGTPGQKFTGRGVPTFYGATANAEAPAAPHINPGRHGGRWPRRQRSSGRSRGPLWTHPIRFRYVCMNTVGTLCQSAVY